MRAMGAMGVIRNMGGMMGFEDGAGTNLQL